MARDIVLVLIVFVSIVLFSNANGSKRSNSFSDLGASDTYLTPLKIVRKHGYPSEAHAVKSQDGYILELHRIPHGKSGPGDKKRTPIFIHHGLLSSSIDWIVNGPDKSLGYRLADEGYDVWLANARGNRFSRSHVRYSPRQKEFWDFSFHEMGFYDLPAAIDHILEMTGEEQVIYIGHSLGTTVFYVMASTLPEYNKKIKFQISLAPVTAITHTTSAYRLLVPQAKMLINMLDWYNKGAFLENDVVTRVFMNFYYGDANVLYSIFGKDPDQFNTTLFPIISSNFPAGTSGKNLIHCAQLISTGTFSHYDYGKTENNRRYGSSVPPKYNINKINVPVRLYSGENDLLSNPIDTKLLYQKLAKPLGLKRINYDKFNHVDFLWANDINQLLNDEIIEFINNSTDPLNGFNFIQDNINEAINNRSLSPAPVDVPFDRKAFMTKIGKDMRQFSPLRMLLPITNENNEKEKRQAIRQKISNVRNAVEFDFKN
ncbi:gastric triacylglycerol lipase-like [Planococcus citri]|uniref:gastric triacylglycerol lipase-like n=1 Tax=Planococcus citri TaxID=170843 RepID=UPI0031F760EE